MTQYVVTAPCLVHVPFDTPQGKQLGTLYAKAILPDSVPSEKIAFWLEAGMIAPVRGAVEGKSQGSEPVKLDQGGTLPSGTTQEQVKTPEQVTPEPVAPPTSGAGSGKEAWVDHAVALGMDRAAAERMSRDDLIKALKPAE